jgi:hypothetical protein
VALFARGDLVLEGIEPVNAGADWSIEYCENHDTPIRYESVWLDSGLTLFAIVADPVSLTGVPTYEADGLPKSNDLTGLFLVDKLSGEATTSNTASTLMAISG